MCSHTLEWLNAKVERGQKEKYEQSQSRVWENVKGLLVTLDYVFNKGKNANKLMPSYEEMLQQQKESVKKEETFITGQWWLKK